MVSTLLLLLSLYSLFLLPNQSSDHDHDNIGIRKDVIELTRTEKDNILNAIYLMKSIPSKFDSNYSAWDYYAWVHGEAFRNITHIYGHERWSFLPWHRAFNWILEQEMQHYMNDTSIRLPYWDPSNELSTYLTLYDTTFLGGNGNNNTNPPWILPENASLSCSKYTIRTSLFKGLGTAFDNYTCLARQIGLNFDLPEPHLWQDLIDEGLDYDVYPYDRFEQLKMNGSLDIFLKSFRGRLEGIFGLTCAGDDGTVELCPFLHGGLHTHIGGQVTTAPATVDPLFFLIHNWVDLVWAKYQDKYGLYHTFPSELLDFEYFQGLFFKGFNVSKMNSRDVMDHRKSLNYMYSVQLNDENGNKNKNKAWYEFSNTEIIIITASVIGGLVVIVICYCLYAKRKAAMETENYSKM